MISFDFDSTAIAISDEEYQTLYAKQKDLIAQALSGTLPYPDCLDWHHVDRWANDVALDA